MPEHVLVVSHQRSGTHLTIDLVRNNFPGYDRYWNLDRLTPRHQDPLPPSELERALRTGPQILKTHTHAKPDRYFSSDDAPTEENARVASFVNKLLDEATVLYVVRDGRDVMSSLYYYLSDFRPEVAEQPLESFLRGPNRLEVDASVKNLCPPAYWAHHVSGWLEHEKPAVVRFESMVEQFDDAVAEIETHLHATARRPLTNVVRSERRTGSRSWSGQIQDKIHKLYMKYVRDVALSYTSFRTGRSGTHREEFSEEAYAAFEDHAGNALDRLGYR